MKDSRKEMLAEWDRLHSELYDKLKQAQYKEYSIVRDKINDIENEYYVKFGEPIGTVYNKV